VKRYNPAEVEAKWQAVWEKNQTYRVDLSDHSKPKYVAFSMLPGITGAGIHIGHGRTFQFSDIKVRAKRQQGYNAYHPIGWDSFGLPVENYAIKIGKTPRVAHDEAKANFIRQLKRLGYSYDWSKEISTADPEYYRWTQWIFAKLYEHNLAYQKESLQWWCDTDNTVLANEQVEAGKCWRCHNPVTKRNLKQWFFRITEYADEILEATDELDWTPMVKTMQKNWIGRSKGAEIEFAVKDHSEAIKVFTTRADTIYGVTFMVLAPEHPLVDAIVTDTQRDAVQAYVAEAKTKSDIERQEESREKTGVFTGAYAINPMSGEEVPVWVADYVLYGYGTGAIMAVPAHDDRDGAFAKAFDLPMVQVVAQDFGVPLPDCEDVEGVNVIGYDPITKRFMSLHNNNTGQAWLVSGGREQGETFEAVATRELAEEAGCAQVKSWIQLGEKHFSYYYNDNKKSNRRASGYNYLAVISESETAQSHNETHEDYAVTWSTVAELRTAIAATGGGVEHWLDAIDQAEAAAKAYDAGATYAAPQYHGDGIVVNSGVYDGQHSEAVRELVVQHLEREGKGREHTNYKIRDWLISRQRYWGAPIPIVHCATDGAVALPDDQLPLILPEVEDYRPTGGNTSVLASLTDWVNTTCPKCGGPATRETDTMDGYACSSWYFLRYLDPTNATQAWSPDVEKHWGPIDFYNGADHAVAHLLYARFWMRFFYKLGLVGTPEPFKRMMYNAYILAGDGRKMSKSLGNVSDPLEIMDSGYGADSLRLYEMFIAPYDQEAPWDTRGVPGTYRFLTRIWSLVQDYLEAPTGDLSADASAQLGRAVAKAAKKVTSDIENDKFNTAVSAMMELVNACYKLRQDGNWVRGAEWQAALDTLCMLLAPFAPHISEEMWQQLGHDDTVHVDHWPIWDEASLVEALSTIIVQVNGKVRAQLTVDAGANKATVLALARANEHVAKYLGDAEPSREVFVPGRLVNFVV
jgi:leucyl-tRNA synthetase